MSSGGRGAGDGWRAAGTGARCAVCAPAQLGGRGAGPVGGRVGAARTVVPVGAVDEHLEREGAARVALVDVGEDEAEALAAHPHEGEAEVALVERAAALGEVGERRVELRRLLLERARALVVRLRRARRLRLRRLRLARQRAPLRLHREDLALQLLDLALRLGAPPLQVLLLHLRRLELVLLVLEVLLVLLDPPRRRRRRVVDRLLPPRRPRGELGAHRRHLLRERRVAHPALRHLRKRTVVTGQASKGSNRGEFVGIPTRGAIPS